jgi:hypothetical protein
MIRTANYAEKVADQGPGTAGKAAIRLGMPAESGLFFSARTCHVAASGPGFADTALESGEAVSSRGS